MLVLFTLCTTIYECGHVYRLVRCTLYSARSKIVYIYYEPSVNENRCEPKHYLPWTNIQQGKLI